MVGVFLGLYLVISLVFLLAALDQEMSVFIFIFCFLWIAVFYLLMKIENLVFKLKGRKK